MIFSIVTKRKCRKERITENMAEIVDKRNAYRIVVGKPLRKHPLVGPRIKWVDNIKINLKDVGCEDEMWMEVTQNRVQLLVLFTPVSDLQVMLP
jgi:RNase H-fold protein (predicted Holliday junction resolvase)